MTESAANRHRVRSWDGAFGGSVEAAVMVFTSRKVWSFLDATQLKLMLRTFGSTLWMLPWQQVRSWLVRSFFLFFELLR